MCIRNVHCAGELGVSRSPLRRSSYVGSTPGRGRQGAILSGKRKTSSPPATGIKNEVVVVDSPPVATSSTEAAAPAHDAVEKEPRSVAKTPSACDEMSGTSNVLGGVPARRASCAGDGHTSQGGDGGARKEGGRVMVAAEANGAWDKSNSHGRDAICSPKGGGGAKANGSTDDSKVPESSLDAVAGNYCFAADLELELSGGSGAAMSFVNSDGVPNDDSIMEV